MLVAWDPTSSLAKASDAFPLKWTGRTEQTSKHFVILILYISSFQSGQSNDFSCYVACSVALPFPVRPLVYFLSTVLTLEHLLGFRPDLLSNIQETLVWRRNPGLVQFGLAPCQSMLLTP